MHGSTGTVDNALSIIVCGAVTAAGAAAIITLSVAITAIPTRWGSRQGDLRGRLGLRTEGVNMTRSRSSRVVGGRELRSIVLGVSVVVIA